VGILGRAGERARGPAVGVIRRISEKRNEHILRKARPFLTESEEVVDWVRARHPEDGRRGIFYITAERCVVHWSGRKDGHASYEWHSVEDWGIDRDSHGGPTLRIQTSDEVRHIQLVVETKGMAATLGDFLQRFADLAPWPPDPALHNNGARHPVPVHEELKPARRSPPQIVRRIVLTVLGASLIVVGIVIIPLPGPWSFVLNIAGLAILAREYDWADDLLDWTKEKFSRARDKVTGRNRTPS
jgi:uncharacterized protein (TIGR02611 family)